MHQFSTRVLPFEVLFTVFLKSMDLEDPLCNNLLFPKFFSRRSEECVIGCNYSNHSNNSSV